MTKSHKIVGLILVCCGLCVGVGFADQQKSTDPNQPVWAKVISPEKLKEDLDFLFKTIEEIHPNMYAYTPKKEFIPIRDELYRQINRPTTRLEFYKLTAPVVASLKNGHTFLVPFIQEYKQHLGSGGKVFPLELRWDDSKTILSKNYSSTSLPLGGAILTINGQSAPEVFESFSHWFAAEGKSTNLRLIENAGLLGALLLLEFGPIESWRLKIKTNDTKVSSYVVKSASAAELQGRGSRAIFERNNSYQYFPENKTALLVINSFGGDMGKFKSFLNQSFQKVHNQKVSSFIIDIRENPGGSDMNADALLVYLTAKPYRQFEEARIKLSSQDQKRIAPLRQQSPKLFENKKVGDIITLQLPFKTPPENPLRFTDNIFVLIGPRSFSTSTSFAATVKQFSIGKLIGVETGDPTIVYGHTVNIRLPNSGLLASAPGRAFVLPGGKPGVRGVIPDYEVQQKPEDTAKGVDTVLQFTLNLIKKSNSKITSVRNERVEK